MNPSILITPNYYGEGKLLSIIPTDGTGDLDVVRATTATLVNSEGVIEDCPYNLIKYSEQFDNAYWVKNNISVTANNTSSPSGTMTADLVASTSVGGNIHSTSFVGSTGSVYSFSFYIKNNTSTSTLILVRETSTVLSATINWSGANISSITNTIGSISSTALTNGWFLIKGTYTAIENNQQIRIYPQSFSGTNSVFLWGAQLEKGSTAKPYFKTTDRLNVPRLDYTNGSCPSILVEPQRTNVLTNSDGNLDTYTTTLNVSNAGVPINGFTNSIQFGDNSVQRYSYKRNFTPIIGVEYTMSFFIQMDDNSLPVLGTSDSTGDFALAMNGNLASLNPKIQKLGTTNVYRVSVSIIATTVDTRFGVRKFPTQSVKGFKVTGYQLEAGPNATSYIPTVASAVTRNADVISKSGISSLINSQEGVLFCEISALSNDITDRLISLTNGTSTERISIYYSSNASNEIKAIIFVGGAIQCNFSYTGSDITNMAKIALKYKQNDFSLFVNGIKRATDNSGITFPANKLNKLSFDLGLPTITLPFNGNVKKIAVFPTALSDVELSQLTTL